MKKIGGSCFRTKGKPRLEELSDKFHSSKSSAESKSVTESSGFDSKARIMVSWSGRKRTSSILILLTTVGKRVNNLAKEQWFDCTIRRSIVEKPINFPPLPLPQLSVSHHFDKREGWKGSYTLFIVKLRSNVRFQWREIGGWTRKASKRMSDESRLTTTPRYFFNFSHPPPFRFETSETRPSEI